VKDTKVIEGYIDVLFIKTDDSMIAYVLKSLSE